jgi:hypothetical protein
MAAVELGAEILIRSFGEQVPPGLPQAVSLASMLLDHVICHVNKRAAISLSNADRASLRKKIAKRLDRSEVGRELDVSVIVFFHDILQRKRSQETSARKWLRAEICG